MIECMVTVSLVLDCIMGCVRVYMISVHKNNEERGRKGQSGTNSGKSGSDGVVSLGIGK
jgi:hypothetical protein